MSESTVEKVARACCEAGHHAWPTTDGYNDRAEKDAWMKVARAAIEAMREPTDAMLKHGGIAFYDSKEVVLAARLPEAWDAMVSAALNEQVSG